MARKSNNTRNKRKLTLYSSQNGTNEGSTLVSARTALLAAAKKHFAVKGLTGTSIRDIAKDAGMNSSMISYYFEGKIGLYKACLEQIGESRLTFAREVLTPAETKEEFRLRLQLFLDNLFQVFLEDREAGLIVIREYDRIQSPAEDVFKKYFLNIFDAIINYFKEAQDKGFVDQSKDTFILASLFFGLFSSQLRLDLIKEKTYGKTIKDKKQRVLIRDHILDLFL